ncbi:MAG: cupin domain-containing protein [Candidatus Binataceae bacterium]
MPLVDRRKIPEVIMRAGVSGQFIVGKDAGASGLTVLLNVVEPGASIPLHKHTAEESGVILEGVIWARIEDQRYQVTPDETIVFPPTLAHAWGNDGPGPARVLWVWNSPDPFGDSQYMEGEPPREH